MQYDIRFGGQAEQPYTGSFLFVVSHMRSYSSLLCHILGSHPEISGYEELLQSYVVTSSLDRLARKIRDRTGNAPLGRYLLDKILHSHLEIGSSILARPDVRCIFLLRDAGDTMRSLRNTLHALGDPDRYTDVGMLAYYTDRLNEMVRYSERLGDRSLFIDSEQLLSDTGAVLDRLSQWLALAEPLREEYRTFPHTGVAGHGDPSPNIKAGRVIRSVEERHRDYVPVAIPDDVLERANAAYARCRAALSHLR